MDSSFIVICIIGVVLLAVVVRQKFSKSKMFQEERIQFLRTEGYWGDYDEAIKRIKDGEDLIQIDFGFGNELWVSNHPPDLVWKPRCSWYKRLFPFAIENGIIVPPEIEKKLCKKAGDMGRKVVKYQYLT